MKHKLSNRVLSAVMAFVMMFLMIPFGIISISAEEDETILPQIDYTPFLLESVNNHAVYNQKTAEMCFELQVAAENYVVNNAKEYLMPVGDGSFSFSYNGNQYSLSSIHISDPAKQVWYEALFDNTCGLLAGMMNYTDADGNEKHTMLISFAGTQKNIGDITTDLAVMAKKIDSNHWYHYGFYEAAEAHYMSLQNAVFSMGNGISYTFDEYVAKASELNDNYQIIVTGHSLGAAVANIFTSYFIDTLYGNGVQKNTIAYTFASPLTCSDGTALKTGVPNVYNYVNTYDWVPMVGYGAVKNQILSVQGGREGRDLTYTTGDPSLEARLPLRFTNHGMKSSVYGDILAQANRNIYSHISTFVLYDNYDKSTHTYQRIVFNNGQLIVSGNGTLVGDWTENTLVEWAKVKNDCTSLVFELNCSITEIGDYAFAGMSQLTNELDLPETLTKIGNYAFFHCGFNGDLIIPSGMKKVGISAFNGCSNLDSIDAQAATAMTWGYGAFANCVDWRNLYLCGIEQKPNIDDVFASYYTQDSKGQISVITPQNKDAANIVLPGDKIYMGRVSEEMILTRPHTDFFYRLSTEDTTTNSGAIERADESIFNGMITVDRFGCVTISNDFVSTVDQKEFTVIVLENYKGEPDTEWENFRKSYSIHFTVGVANNNFEGGLGTEERPYLIRNRDQLIRIKDDLSACYKLIADINFEGETIAPLGTLTGTLDGNGYAIYGFNINASDAGLFNVIAQNACVKNLSIGKQCDDAYSVTVSGGNNAGALACINRGIIENCSLVKAQVKTAASYDWGVNSTIYTISGGIVADNYGTIKFCNITLSSISSSATTTYDSNPARCEAYSGAGVGVNREGGVVNNLSSINNTISGYTYSRDDNSWWNVAGEGAADNQGRGFTYCGGIVAYNASTSTTLESSYSYNNSLNGSRDSDGGSVTNHVFIALAATDAKNCSEEVENCVRQISSLKCDILPNKTNYYIGESLNLYGLIVRDNNNNLVNGYTIDGFESNKSGEQTITVEYATGYGTFTDTFTVTVENIIPQTVIVQPKEDCYDIQNTLSNDDFTATIYYNNGTTETMESLAENTSDIVKFTVFSNLMDTKNEQVLQLNYHYAYMTVDGKAAASNSIVAYVAVTVNCDCLSTTTLNAMPATVSEYGYTGDVVCTTCQSIVEEGTIIDMLKCTDHNYGEWVKYDNTQHFRTCSCGEKEYGTHNWDSGAITLEPTYTTEGVKTYTCVDCGATTTEPISIPIFPENTPHFVVDSKNAVPGENVTVKIKLQNNPGITSMKVNVGYDASLLTLTGVEYNTAMGGQSILPENIEALNGNVVLYWTDGFVNYEGDDVFVTLTFSVSPDATLNTFTQITVSYDPEDVYNVDENNVTFFCKYGEIKFVDYTPGDINGDGVVNTKDTTRLMRYLADWDVEVNEAALDVNGDEVVNTKDTTRLMRYLADWDVEIY